MTGTMKERRVGSIHYGRPHPQQHARTLQLEVQDDLLALVGSAIPCFDGNLDPRAYIDWELKVEYEFDEYDLSEAQMIYIASNALTEYALVEWRHICRHKRIPQSWKGFKCLFREAFIPAYYVDHLLVKLDNLKQGSRTVDEYYHEFKICVLFGGLEKCKTDVLSRFMKGLNSEIRTMLRHKTYIGVGHLFLLARIAEKDILLSTNTCMKNVTHNYPLSSTPHANQEHKIVKPTADLPLSQGELLAEPCDKEELCDISSFATSPQLDGEHTLVSFSATNILQENENKSKEYDEGLEKLKDVETNACAAATTSMESKETNTPCMYANAELQSPIIHGSLSQSLVETSNAYALSPTACLPYDNDKLCEPIAYISKTLLVHGHENSFLNDQPAEVRRVHCINSEEDELQIISSLNCLGYIEFDLSYDLNSFEDELFWKSGLQYLDYCTFHALGLYDNNNSYIVQKVYICSDLTTSFMVPLSDQKVTCIEANNTISSFSPVDHTLQVNFQEGEPCLQQCGSVDVLDLCSNGFDKALLPNINNDAKPRTVCSQEGKNDEIMHMFASPGADIRMPPWPPPFTIMGGHGGDAVLKMNLSRG